MTNSTKTTRLTRTFLLSILSLTSALFVASAALPKSAADDGTGTVTTTATPANFTNYELAGNPFVPPFDVGVTCPNSGGSCNNTEAEPAIRADRAGNFYGSSENVFCVVNRQCGGTFAWKSTDVASHFTTLLSPDSVSLGPLGESLSGGDTDLAVAPQRNSNGFFNVYVASLDSSLANIVVSTSKDGGATWTIHPTGASIPVDDREWVAADGASKVCVSFRAPVPTTDIFVNCSFDSGLTFTQTADAFDANHLFLGVTGTRIGNLAIDPGNHVIYQAFSGRANAGELLSAFGHVVYAAVSIDGGRTFTDHVVYNNPNTAVGYNHQFVNVSVDSAGNVYVVYSDDHNLFYSFSKTFGQTWSGPFQINQSPSNTAIFPWSTALGSGGLDVVWYGTDYCCTGTRFGGGSGPTFYNMSALWHVYFAQNLQATTPGSSFTQVAASGIIHQGDVCEAGTGCSSSQNRDLLDDFGVAASPTTGSAAIIYTSDQYVGTTAEPAQNKGTRGGCTPSRTNTVDCSHTDIAVQTAGSTLNQKKHNFEIDEEDFEETDLANDGGHTPVFNIHGTDMGSSAITSVAAQISGLPLTLSFNTAFPIQPGQDARASTTTLPLGLIPLVGSIYTLTVTATMSDGTTETQTTSVIYTLGAGLGL